MTLVAFLSALSCTPSPPPPPLVMGQWVWSDADAAVFRESQGAVPELIPTVWVWTVTFAGGELQSDLGEAPGIVSPPRAIVIRLDDSLHAAWEPLGRDAVAAGIDGELRRLMVMVDARDRQPVEVQLDYDCPISHLPDWSAALGHITTSSLRGRKVWVTSLVAHLRDPRYGDLFRDRVAGHVLQLFDTGDERVPAAEVAAVAERAAMPYRIGLGAFERERDGVVLTAHRDAFARLPETCLRPRCEGVWVFPAGRTWVDLLPEPP